MNKERLTHTPSEVAAFRLTELVATLLREEEQSAFYQRAEKLVRDAIDADRGRRELNKRQWQWTSDCPC
jgi:hypothetical protein